MFDRDIIPRRTIFVAQKNCVTVRTWIWRFEKIRELGSFSGRGVVKMNVIEFRSRWRSGRSRLFPGRTLREGGRAKEAKNRNKN
jgi:hypothetical protein